MTKNEPEIIIGDHAEETIIFEIQSYLGAIEKYPLLYQEKNFDKRMEVTDFLGFHIIDRIEDLLRKTIKPENLVLLKHQAEKIKADLEEIDINLYQKLRANLRINGYTGEKFTSLVNDYFDFNSVTNLHHEEPGYDNLDIFINELLSCQTIPEQTIDLEPEMVYYQKTPARIVFELAKKSHFKQGDVFFDLGAGLGQVAILINLFTGIKTIGVEFEPAFCDYAKDCATELNLFNVIFINTDARKADYSEGTVFFMFTPFKGKIMKEVLAVLRLESLLRRIKIITYGPCTAQVALQGWLAPEAPNNGKVYKLAVFNSV